jgi:putative peptidoglycan lipid II flippase
LVNAFYALDRRKTPMIVSFLAVGLNLLFNWVFTFRLGLGHRGLAFSTGCVATCNFLLLYALMRRELKGLESGRLLATLAKVGAAGAALAAVCAAGNRWLLADWPTQALGIKIAALAATIVVAGGVFVLVAALLRVEELTAVLAAVRRRLSRAR